MLGTNDIDFRSRALGQEAQFLAAAVAGRPMAVSYADLEIAPAVLLAGFEPKRSRPSSSAAAQGIPQARPEGHQHRTVATRGLTKMGGTLIATAPGGEAADARRHAHELPSGTVILVGERLRLARRLLAAPDWPLRPEHGSAGCRDAQATAVRWKPVRRPIFCLAAGRSTIPARAARWPPPGTSTTYLPHPAATRRASSVRRPTVRSAPC
jgi:hypothetical protein